MKGGYDVRTRSFDVQSTKSAVLRWYELSSCLSRLSDLDADIFLKESGNCPEIWRYIPGLRGSVGTNVSWSDTYLCTV